MNVRYNFMVILKAEDCGAVELDCVILTGVYAFYRPDNGINAKYLVQFKQQQPSKCLIVFSIYSVYSQ